MEAIIWRSISGFEGLYSISNTGTIISHHKRNANKVITQRNDRGGYKTVRLSKNGKVSTQFVHRLMALTFIDSLFGKKFVNHIDGDKQNNSVENLEWVSHSENMIHAYKIGLVVKSKHVARKVVDMCSGTIYKSIKEASDKTGIPYSTCKNFLNGNRINKTCLQMVA